MLQGQLVQLLISGVLVAAAAVMAPLIMDAAAAAAVQEPPEASVVKRQLEGQVDFLVLLEEWTWAIWQEAAVVGAVKLIMAKWQAGTQNLVEVAVLERIQRRMGLVAVLSTVPAAAGLATLQGRQIAAAQAEVGTVIRLGLAGLVEPMMAAAVLMEHRGLLDAVMAAAAAVTAVLPAWDRVGKEECQAVVAAPVGEGRA
jgi:hypothetical protein